MSSKRAPMTPPDLPGFTYLDVLGSGGFADVYLYEQQLPRRRVAVKVLLTDRISTGSVAEFTAEANVMAMLSTHPAIVTIYQAGVARDGRPYLVMEYCPKPNLQVRYRREAFSIAESLRVGIQVAAAVETAHRAGVLHRDIKPANILVTEYNRPALTDFGIASTTAAAAESAGLSIPWSPPESFADVPRSDPRSDVYALGATVYTLLAGRSPFELAGQRNTAADLIQRIETMPLPPLGRADAPASLQRTLDRAMAKSSADRYESAIAFARALQKVQIELSHSVTPIDILDDGVPDDVTTDEDDGLTRVRGVVSIDPETSPAAGLTRPSVAAAAPPVAAPVIGTVPDLTTSAHLETVRRDVVAVAPAPVAPAPGWDTGRFEAPVDETIVRVPTAETAPAVIPPEQGEAKPVSRRTLWWSLAAVAVVMLAAVIVIASLPRLFPQEAKPTANPTVESDPQDPIGAAVKPPEDLVGKVTSKGVVFTWTNPDPHDGDVFMWSVEKLGTERKTARTTEATVTVPEDSSGRTCIQVEVRREDGKSSDAVLGCVPK